MTIETVDVAVKRKYWKEQLDIFSPCCDVPQTLLLNKKLESVLTSDGGRSTLKIKIPDLIVTRLQSICKESPSLLHISVTAAVTLCLRVYLGNDFVSVGVPAISDTLDGNVNILPISLNLHASDTFRVVLKNFRNKLQLAYLHQEFPYHVMAGESGRSELTGTTADFGVVISTEGLHGTLLKINRAILINVFFEDAGIGLEFEYEKNLYQKSVILAFFDHICSALNSTLENINNPISQVNILSSDEIHIQKFNWNSMASVDMIHPNAVKAFEYQVAVSPDAPCLIWENEIHTYGDVNRRANKLAHFLVKKGVKPDDLVGICLERSAEMVVSIFGIIKAGAAYVPLDPDLPIDRLRGMIEDSRKPIILTQDRFLPMLLVLGCEADALESICEEMAESSEENLDISIEPNGLAYMIFTSGSTGRPKGAMNTHEALMNRIYWMQETMELGAADRVLQKTPFSFDVSVWEFFWPCFFGAAIVIPKPGGHLDSSYLIDTIKTHDVTTLHFVPSMLRVFLDEPSVSSLTSIIRVVCSGEALAKDLVLRFHETLKIDLFNLYGPTEAAIDISYYPCKSEDMRKEVPIGWPIQNNQLYIVDKDCNLAPIGAQGEIYIGGVALARGYYNQPALTAEKFVPDPFSGRSGSRLYRTGDLARYLSDGAIEYLGRIDNQVKIRGRRIELGEIEAALLVNPLVKDTVVIVREDVPLQKYIIAYVIALADVDDGTFSKLLKIELSKILPEYMIPLTIIIINKMPLSPNGKIDRRKLPRPQFEVQAVLDQLAMTPLEISISNIWCDLLRLESLDVQTNLFEMGSDSIVSMQAVSRFAKIGIQLNFRDVMKFPTVKEQALIASRPIQNVGRMQHIMPSEGPLSPMQDWFFSKESQPRNHWNMSLTLDFPSRTNLIHLTKALQFVFQTHESLKTFFFRSNGNWTQRVTSTQDGSILIQFEDHSEKEMSEAVNLRSQGRFRISKILDIEKGPIAAAIFFKGGDAHVSYLFLTVHHLVVDAVSLRIIIEDVNSVYEQLKKEEQPSLPVQMTSFLSWTNEISNLYKNGDHAEIEYWRSVTEGSKDSWPAKYSEQLNIESLAATETISFSVQDTEALQKIAELNRSNIGNIILAAFIRELSKVSGSDIVYLDVEGHGRETFGAADDVSRTVGWFSSLYPVAINASGNPSLEAMLLRVKATLREIPNSGVGFGALLAYGSNEICQYIRHTHIRSICFNFFGTFDSGSKGGIFNLIRDEMDQMVDPAAKRAYDIEISGEVRQDLLYISIRFGTQRYVSEEIAVLLGNVRASLVGSTRIQSAMDYQQWPITPIQDGMLFQSSIDPESGLYTMQMACTLLGSFDSSSFTRAWVDVMNTHSILRAAFITGESGNYTMIIRDGIQMPISQLDWSGEDLKSIDQKLADFLINDRRKGFQYFKAPLMRGAIVRLSEDRHYFIWTHHHLILDGWSVGVVLKDLFARYKVNIGMSLDNGPIVAGSFSKYLSWLSKRPFEMSRGFWQRALAGLTEPTQIHLARDETEHHLMKTTGHKKVSFTLEGKERDLLSEFANIGRVTLSTVFQGVWALLLKNYSGNSDVCFGTVVSTRPIEFIGDEPTAGPFINTLPLRLKINENEISIDWLRSVQIQVSEMLNHAHCSLVDIQSCSDIPREMSLFDSIFAFENYPISESLSEKLGEINIENIEWHEGTEFPLSLVVVPGVHIKVELQYRSDHFSELMMSRLMLDYKRLLKIITTNPDLKLREISINDANELKWQIETFNDTTRSFEDEATIHSLFQQKAAEIPESIAVIDGKSIYTFSDINSKSNQLGAHLRAIGVRADKVVGICLTRSVNVVISILSILKSGGAYVLLETNLPSNRMATIIEQAKIQFVITSVELLVVVPPNVKCIAIDKDLELWNALPSENLHEAAHPLSLAYVLFTSGSTGQPKGVMIHHRALVNYVSWCVSAYQFQKGNGAPLISSLSFDLPITALFGSLISGRPLHILSEHESLDALVERLSVKTEFSLVKLTPAHLNVLSQSLKDVEPENGTKVFVIGGEQLNVESLTWFKRTMPGTLLVNEYGPTETVVGCSIHVVGSNTPAVGAVPIGTPIANTQLYILSSDMRTVPRGATGELFIGGIGVCRGYLDNPEITAEFFVPDPFSAIKGARLYRTGDLVRFNENGEMVFVGRKDFQVKIRGFRVELGDIESALNMHEHVSAAVVLPIQKTDGPIDLVAYVACFVQTVDETMLRLHLQNCLPMYMIPSVIVILKAFPLTINGKIDRHALAKIPVTNNKTHNDEPLTYVEKKVLVIWEEILGMHVSAIGKYDDFFAVGGHSLMAAQVRARINTEFSVSLSLKTVFLRRTIAEIANEIEAMQKESDDLLERLEGLSDDEVESLLLQEDI